VKAHKLMANEASDLGSYLCVVLMKIYAFLFSLLIYFSGVKDLQYRRDRIQGCKFHV